MLDPPALLFRSSTPIVVVSELLACTHRKPQVDRSLNWSRKPLIAAMGFSWGSSKQQPRQDVVAKHKETPKASLPKPTPPPPRKGKIILHVVRHAEVSLECNAGINDLFANFASRRTITSTREVSVD